MGVETHNSAGEPDWLLLLHREADGELTPDEAARLAALLDQPDVVRQRAQLQQVAALVAGRPQLPRSVATEVAQDIALQAYLKVAVPVPPVSVAAQVAAEVRLAGQLSRPALPHSVAAHVAQDITLGATLDGTRPRLPHSVAAAVAAEVALGQQVQGTVPPPVPSVAAPVAAEVAWQARLAQPAPPVPRKSVAAQVAARVAQETAPLPVAPPVSPPLPVAAVLIGRRRNPAPLFLVVSLLAALMALAISSAWPNLAAGALVFQTLLAQVSPVAGAGLALLLLTSLLVTWRPGPAAQRLGGAAFALSAVLTLPALYEVTTRGTVTFGQDVVVSGPVNGNVIAVGGSVQLQDSAQVKGEVVALLGDVRRAPGAEVQGRVNALMGRAPGDTAALQTPVPSGLSAMTASAFRPVLGWLGAAAWPQVFVTLTAGALLLLFVSGLAPLLARRQRHAPMRTLALGVLALAALLGPAGGLALVGLLGPALIAAALAALLIAVGLSVSAYDAGRTLAYRARLPLPDMVGAMMGLSAVAASLSLPPLAFAVALIGGTWGAGTLLLTRTDPAPASVPATAA
ncbi:bactofilin family protein [Deinococcus aquaedulcis]|uniref:polymer-forming cytoskeletal protein n=1 Tax=Deinococcus aquaedulcis TaxID=2840455 RepID=UPI001C832B1F|nr:polymer-forming cytoskeletal protein [Deinococcus aquaedulcis]